MAHLPEQSEIFRLFVDICINWVGFFFKFTAKTQYF